MKTRYQYTSGGVIYSAWLEKGQYANGRTAITLMSEEGPVATVTVNIPDADLSPGDILVKTWSENEGMVNFLADNKIVQDMGHDVPTGFVTARVCRLLV